MSQYQFTDSAQRLSDLLKQREAETPPNNLEEADIDLTRAVRSTFTFFIQSLPFHIKPGDENDITMILKDAFSRALAILEQSDYPTAKGYRKSVADKMETLTSMQTGLSFVQAEELRRQFAERDPDSNLPPFSFN